MKTVLEEQEIQSPAHAGSQHELSKQQKAKVGHVKAAQAIAVKTETDSYPSCLDLAAEFIARG